MNEGEAIWLFMMERQNRPRPRTRFCGAQHKGSGRAALGKGIPGEQQVAKGRPG